MLVRCKQDKSVVDRFVSEIVESHIFETLRSMKGLNFEDWVRNSVVPISGDLLEQGMGLSTQDRENLLSSVSIIVHAAASVDFDLPLDEATRINIDGSLEVLALASGCNNLKARRRTRC